jgi:transposase
MFVEAVNGRTKTDAAHTLVCMIGKLYQPRRAADSLDHKASEVLLKGLVGEGIQYIRKQSPILITFLQDGHLEIDNILAEMRSGRSPSGARPGSSARIIHE